MLIQAMVQTPIPGQLDRFNRFLQMNMALAAAHGVGTSLKVSSFGTAGVEIYLMQQFANWEEYGEKTDAMRGDPAWRQIMDFGGGSQPFAENIDSFCASAIPELSSQEGFSAGPVLATVWAPHPKRLGATLEAFARGKAVHEPEGCKVRVFQILGGRFCGQLLYNMSFESNQAFGRCMAGIQEPHAALMADIDQDPVADMTAQFKMDNPVLVG